MLNRFSVLRLASRKNLGAKTTYGLAALRARFASLKNLGVSAPKK